MISIIFPQHAIDVNLILCSSEERKSHRFGTITIFEFLGGLYLP